MDEIATPQLRDEKGRLVKGTPGKQLGTQNRLTKTVKSTVLAVFNELQTDPKHSLESFAKKYPRDFYAIAARLIPLEVTGSLKHIINVTDTEEDKEQIQEAEIVNGD